MKFYLPILLMTLAFCVGCGLMQAPQPVVSENEKIEAKKHIDEAVKAGKITYEQGEEAKRVLDDDTMTPEAFEAWKAQQGQNLLQVISQWADIALGGGAAGTVVWLIRRMLLNSQQGKILGPVNGNKA